MNKLDPEHLFTLSLVSLIGVMALAPLMLLPMYVLAFRDLLGIDPGTAGKIVSAALAGIAVMTLIVSLKAKTWNLTTVTVLGMIVVLVFNIAMLFFTSATALTILGFIGGLGGGAAQAAVAAALARTKNSEKAFGIYIAWQFLLPAIGFYWFARLLFDEAGYGGIFTGFNAMLLVLIVLDIVAIIVVSVMANYKLSAKEASSSTMELGLILKPAALLSLLALMIYGAANAAIWAYAEGIGLLAIDDIDWIGDTLAYITAASVIGPVLVTVMGDKFGHFGPLTIGVVLQLVGMYFLITIATPTGYIIGMGLFSIAWAFTWPYFLCIQASFDKTGSVVACGQFTNLLGNSIGPFVAALFVGSEGDYVGAIWVAAVLFVATLVPVFLIKVVRKGPAS